MDLAQAADDFDREVFRTPDIDRFCSSAAWILAADIALMPPRAAFSFRGRHGYFAARRAIHRVGNLSVDITPHSLEEDGVGVIEPVELAWGLASPLVGNDVEALVADVISLLANRRDWHLAVFSGLTADGRQRRALDATIPAHWERRCGQSTLRHIASLDGGVDGFLSRRSRDFRKSIRKSLHAAVRDGLSFDAVRVTAAQAQGLYDRIQRVEVASWKSRDGVGIATGPMQAFYGSMLPRLCRLGQQRTMFARWRGRDVGYILGAVTATDYRGLQFSYDDSLRALNIGSLLQYHQICALCDEGVTRYDLGTEMDYKRRWAESVMETELLVVVR